MIEESLDESVIMRCGVESYKSFIKAKVRKAALKHLNKMKEKHSKIKAINYSELKPQEYLVSPIFNDENVSLLFSLRLKADTEMMISSVHSVLRTMMTKSIC